jgi:hypothetical protein
MRAIDEKKCRVKHTVKTCNIDNNQDSSKALASITI